MIERAAYLKVPLRALCSNDKSLNGLCMSESAWKELAILKDLLQKFDRSTKLLSMERHPSICAYIPTLNWLIESVETFITENPGPLADAARIGLEKLQKYEELTLMKNSKIPYMAMFLNPAIKMSYFKEHDYTKPKKFKNLSARSLKTTTGRATMITTINKLKKNRMTNFLTTCLNGRKQAKNPRSFKNISIFLCLRLK